jgi:type VI secretion system protein ImpA
MMSIAELLKPVSDGSPCGPDLSNDGRFDELETLLKGKPEVEIGALHQPAQPPDWAELGKKSAELLRQSKHLRVAVILCCSLLKTQGLPGFRDGLQLIRGLLEQDWSSIYPPLDLEDEDMAASRLNFLKALLPSASRGEAWLTIPAYLDAAPLCQPKGRPPITFEDLESAKARSPEAPGTQAPAPTLAGLAEALRSAGEQVASSCRVIEECIQAVQGIDQFLSTTLGATKAMSFEELTGRLKKMLHGLQPYLRGDAVVEQPGTTAPPVALPSMEPPASGSVGSREDVIRLLDGICRYYEQNEPASPVPYLLRRAKKLVTMNFVQAVAELNLASVEALRPSLGSAADEKAADDSSRS